MKKFTVLLLCIVLALSASACGAGQESRQDPAQSRDTSEYTADTADSSAPSDAPSGSADGDDSSEDKGGNILIAYFTWADNTRVENPDSVDVDAVTSASVLAPGNAARIAAWIRQEIGGDLFSIRVADPYSSDYDECLDRAADEKADNARPALTERVDNIERYDTVFLGYPNWWYSCPMAIFSFIEDNDLSGKKIVLFCTHGTGGLARSVQDIKAALPDDCTVEENVVGIYRPEVDSARSEVQSWLAEIGY